MFLFHNTLLTSKAKNRQYCLESLSPLSAGWCLRVFGPAAAGQSWAVLGCGEQGPQPVGGPPPQTLSSDSAINSHLDGGLSSRGRWRDRERWREKGRWREGESEKIERPRVEEAHPDKSQSHQRALAGIIT